MGELDARLGARLGASEAYVVILFLPPKRRFDLHGEFGETSSEVEEREEKRPHHLFFGGRGKKSNRRKRLHFPRLDRKKKNCRERLPAQPVSSPVPSFFLFSRQKEEKEEKQA